MDLEEVKKFISKARWRYAKTMPKWPHEYTVRDWNDEAEFEDFIRYILECGEFRKEYYWERIYLDVDDWYYWKMNTPIKETNIINRAKRRNRRPC